MGDLTGKVVLITGAGREPVCTLAAAFAARGASLALNDISPVNMDECAARIQAAGGKVLTYVQDIAKKMPVQGLLTSVVDALGRLDILVNCAEVQPARSILEMDDWEWQRTLDVNLTGAFLLTQSAGRIMKEKGAGIIVHFSPPPHQIEKRAAYLASKAGLAALVESARDEYAGYGITLCLALTEEEVLQACLP